MTDELTLDEPTEAEAAAADWLLERITEVCGDPVQAAFHVWSCRRRTLSRGSTDFERYLWTLAAELPRLLTDPEVCRNAFKLQRLIFEAQRLVEDEEAGR